MLRGQDQSIRVEEVTVGERSEWVGTTLGAVDIHRRTGLVPIAVKQPDQQDFDYNPAGDELLQNGTVMIVIGNPTQVGKLRQFCRS
jgi:K+/H+ antiporter YhaU regulatory subunit KhtT